MVGALKDDALRELLPLTARDRDVESAAARIAGVIALGVAAVICVTAIAGEIMRPFRFVDVTEIGELPVSSSFQP